MEKLFKIKGCFAFDRMKLSALKSQAVYYLFKQ